MASSVDIAPALGHGLITTQAGVATGFDAIDDRRQWAVGRQEGVLSATGWKVAQRAAGANMSVDVDADVDPALVKGDSVSNQGLYLVAPHTADINLDGIVAHASLPTIYTVVLDALDDTHAGGGLNKARARLIQGTPTAGATLDNRNGAPSLPSSALLLADILVAAADTSITNSEIRDRRPWANGFSYSTVRTSDFSTAAGPVSIDANFLRRLELGSASNRINFLFDVDCSNASGGAATFGMYLDNVVRHERADNVGAASTPTHFEGTMSGITAGSHTFEIKVRSFAGTLLINGTGTRNIFFAIQEEIRPSADNGTS